MAELQIQDALWRDFVAVAQRQRAQPQELAEQVLRDYIQRFDAEYPVWSPYDAHEAAATLHAFLEREKAARK